MKVNTAILGLLAGAFLFATAFVGFGSKTCATRWEGAIGQGFLEQVRTDLENAKGCEALRVDLFSPGGSVFATLEVVSAMRKAERAGLIIEIHGGVVVASGATFVMGAGSRGRRFVRDHSVALVHGIQMASMYGSACAEYKSEPTTDEERLTNKLIVLLANEYAALSSKSIQETYRWLECDNTQLGFGEMLVKLGLADHVEE